MGVWYPSLVVNLRLRFDEAFNVLEDQSPDVIDPAGAESARSLPSQPPKVRPLLIQGAKDRLTQVAGRLPKSGEVALNGYRQAGTFSFVFDFRDLPIDPRIIRACGVEIFLGVVDPSKFARGMTRVEQDGSRQSVLDTSTSENLLMVGVVDEMGVVHAGKGSLVHMSGRDLRGIFLDGKADPRAFKHVDLTKPIDDVITQILARSPFGDQVNVFANPDDWPNATIPSPAVADSVMRTQLGASGSQRPRITPPGAGDKIGLWDLVTYYCTLVGAIPQFVGRDLQVRPARALYSQKQFDPKFPTPFAGGLPRDLRLGNKVERVNIRQFVYGRDLSDLTFDRKYTGTKVPVVEVHSVDSSSKEKGLKRAIIARSTDNLSSDPKKQSAIAKAKKTSIAPSGQLAQTEILRFEMPGIKDKRQLTIIAKNIAQEIGRGEMGGKASTNDFASFNTDGDVDPDVLHMKPGDAVQFRVDARSLSSRAPLVSELITQTRRSAAEQVAAIKKITGDEDLARVIVATARNSIVELQDTFRTTNVKFSLREGGAVGIDFDFQNYIEARADATNKQQPSNAQRPKGRSAG